MKYGRITRHIHDRFNIDPEIRDSYNTMRDKANEKIMVESQEPELVVHPDHYNQYKGFEVIDICEQLRAPDGSGNFNRGNAFKYLARAGWKSSDKHVQDLEKAIFYLQLEIDRVKKAGGTSESTEKLEERKSAIQQKASPNSHRLICPRCEADLLLHSSSDDEGASYLCPYGHGGMEFSVYGKGRSFT